MFKKIFRPQTTGLAAVILTVASALSYVMGMARDIVFANFYGASDATDAYNAAFLVPDAIFNLFVAGALTAAFIPVFSGYLATKKNEESKILASSFLFLASIVVIIVGGIAYYFMPNIIHAYFSEISGEKVDLIIKMSRILLLSPLLFAVSNTLGNILISYKHFVSYALAPLFYNLGIIIGIVFFAGKYGIFAAAWGAVFGIFLHLLTRLFEIFYTGHKFTFNLQFLHPGMRKIFWLMIPKTIGLMSWQASLWAINFIGNNRIGEGAVTSFYYARNLQSFPVSIFGIALATAIFPYLSDHAAAGRDKIFTHQYHKSLRQILFLSLPAAVGISLLAEPIVRLVYQRGAFDEKDVAVTSAVLLFFALSIPLESAVHLTARAFYAYKNTIVPVIGALLLMISMVGGAYYVAPKVGAYAFSFFFTVGSLIQIFWLALWLRKKLKTFNIRSFFISISKIFISAGAMASVIFALSFIPLGPKLLLIIQIALGGLTYFFFAFILRCDELSEVKEIGKRVLKKFTPNNQLDYEKK